MDKTPRILQVVLSLHPGGTERLVVELVRRLRSGLPMAVCCLDEEGAWGAGLRAEGIDVETIGRPAGFHPLLGRGVARAAARHRASVIHCHHYTPFVYSALARIWNPRLRVVFTEHGRLSDAPPSMKRRVANTLLARVPFQIATVSANLKAHIVAEGFPQDRVTVVYNGIDVGPRSAGRDMAVRRDLGLSDETLVVGTVARLDPVKDLETLVAATRQVSARHSVVLLVIGDGPERGRLEAIAARHATPVRFLGHREDARTLLAACDVYANSSIHEGISLTILEAMAANLPIVATAVGGTPEMLDASCGRLVAPRDATALAGALLELAAQPALGAALGAAGRRRVETQFTIERMVGEYRDAYYRAIGSQSP